MKKEKQKLWKKAFKGSKNVSMKKGNQRYRYKLYQPCFESKKALKKAFQNMEEY